MVDPSGADWYKNKKSGTYDWFNGSDKHKGFKHMKTGTWSGRNGSGFSYYFGNFKDDLIQDGPSTLEAVVVSGKSKKKGGGNIIN